MAEGYIRAFAGNKARVFSAGIEAHGLNRRAVAVMKEDGIDISSHTSKKIVEYMTIDFDYVITVCDNALELCPVFPGKAKKFHHDFPDPAKARGSEDQIRAEFLLVRDQIKEYSRNFVSTNL